MQLVQAGSGMSKGQNTAHLLKLLRLPLVASHVKLAC